MNLRVDSLAAQAALLNELLTASAVPEMRAAGISASVFELLSTISAGHGRDTQVEVAQRMGITPPSLSEAVRAAVSRGLIEQVPSETDGRKKLLKLTRKGRTSLNRIVQQIERAENEMVQGLTEDELSVTLAVLKRLNRQLAVTLQNEGNL